MTSRRASSLSMPSPLELCGSRCATGPRNTVPATIRIAAGRIVDIFDGHMRVSPQAIPLEGYLLLPGLVNPHDHLTFALFPHMGHPPYRNYIEWGEDIHRRFPESIAMHKAVSKETRLWWGGLRNLLCGVTSVSHHDPLWPALRDKEFPVKVVQSNGWAHSPALGGDLISARRATPPGGVFVLHACEGVDDRAREELRQLDLLGLLDAATVLVHGLAIDAAGAEIMRGRNTSLIVCPSSNCFLYGRMPDLPLFSGMQNIALGSDSPLTAAGDLLDEVRFAVRRCGIAPEAAYRMVTEGPAEILRLEYGAGRIAVEGPADLVAVPDIGLDAASTLLRLSHRQIELVILNGRVQLASPAVLERLPHSLRQGLEPLCVDGSLRWLRAPASKLLREAETALGTDQVKLGGKPIRIPA